MSAPKRDWRVRCYGTEGELRECVIDSDHGALRISFTIGESEQLMELRADQVKEFHSALEAAINTLETGGVGEDCPQRYNWSGQCYSSWSDLRLCSIKTTYHSALRIDCGGVLPGEKDCSLEFRADQIGEFRAAFDAALWVFKIDVSLYGEHWADEEDGDNCEELSPVCGEELFATEVNKMISEDAPRLFALVGEIGERVDAMTMVWGMDFGDHTQVISAGHSGVCGSFRSAERAHKILSAGAEMNIRLVWVNDAREQVKAA